MKEKKKDFKELLDDEIISVIEEISSCEIGTEEYGTKVRQLNDLSKIRNDIRREENVKFDNLTSNVIKVGQIIVEVGVPAMIYLYCFDQGLDFEKEGIYRSPTVRNLIARINPFRKKL